MPTKKDVEDKKQPMHQEYTLGPKEPVRRFNDLGPLLNLHADSFGVSSWKPMTEPATKGSRNSQCEIAMAKIDSKKRNFYLRTYKVFRYRLTYGKNCDGLFDTGNNFCFFEI